MADTALVPIKMTPYKRKSTGAILFRLFDEPSVMGGSHAGRQEFLPMCRDPKEPYPVEMVPLSDLDEIKFVLYDPTLAAGMPLDK